MVQKKMFELCLLAQEELFITRQALQNDTGHFSKLTGKKAFLHRSAFYIFLLHFAAETCIGVKMIQIIEL